MQHGVAVREGAAAGVFAGNADIVAGFEQAGIGDGFGHTPVDSLFADRHGFAVVDDFSHGVVQLHIGRDISEFLGQAFDFGSRQSSFHRSAPADGLVFAPIHSVFAFLFGQDFLDAVAFIHRGAVVADEFFGFFLGDHAFFNQLLGIHGAGAGVCGHLFVHQGLGQRRIVAFVVAEFAVAHQIDHDVFLEGGAVVQRDLGGVAHGFRVVAVHVQNRRAHHLGDVGAIQGGAGVARVGSGEAHLVVDHEVDGAAGAVAAGLRHIEGGLVYAQTDEGRVAVGKDGQHLFAAFGTAVVLAGAYGAFNHRISDFQV